MSQQFVTWTWQCLNCEANGTSRTHDGAMGAFDVHHAEAHSEPVSFPLAVVPPPAPRVAISNDDQQAVLDFQRVLAGGTVIALLAATDKWVARAVEDDTTISDDRRAYRVALRAAYQEILVSDDPASVQLPTEPTS